MASSQTKQINGIGEVKVNKKKGITRLSLRLKHDMLITVSQPYYLPFAAGFAFAKQQKGWIIKQKQKVRPLNIYSEMPIGKKHKLVFAHSDKISSRVIKNRITLNMPKSAKYDDPAVITEAKKAIKRALNKEAKELLPIRLEQLAIKYGYSYKNVNVKPMKSRWGSCSTNKTIALNSYLLMLPWPIIDYVIMHELSHTVHMNHSASFWLEVRSTVPNYSNIKKELKDLQPDIYALYI